MAEFVEIWGKRIEYDELELKLQTFSTFLKLEAEKSISKLISLGKKKDIGWGIRCWEFPPKEMSRVCDLVGEYVTREKILLTVPNWSMFLPQYLELAEQGTKIFREFLDIAYNVAALQARQKYETAYQQALSNSQGLEFGIISNSFTDHLLYIAQSARKEQENQKKAHDVAQQVYQNNNPFVIGDALINDFYDSNFEPFLIDVLVRFYGDLRCLVYQGAEKNVLLSNEKKEPSKNLLADQGDTNKNKTLVSNALSIDITCSSAIIFAIENNLVDDDFKNFFANTPQILKTNTKKAIIDYFIIYARDTLSR